jgi:hypothetical protein
MWARGVSGRQEFGDGIMTAIDFDTVTGDCVKIGMTGKFLPFRYYGGNLSDGRSSIPRDSFTLSADLHTPLRAGSGILQQGRRY